MEIPFCSGLNGGPLKDMLMFKYLATVSVILFGVKVFADMPVKDLEIKVLWITQMGPKSN